jgi:hypothetical protein
MTQAPDDPAHPVLAVATGRVGSRDGWGSRLRHTPPPPLPPAGETRKAKGPRAVDSPRLPTGSTTTLSAQTRTLSMLSQTPDTIKVPPALY